MRELLRLLAEDASGSELARVAGEDAVARDLALRIRAGIDASKKREAELSALVEVARELASARDPSGVLDTIVHRARTLIGTDVAYLTLYDEAQDDTYMRATDGSVSAAFQQLRVPSGDGLGGLVASTRRPYWTTDYPSDQRFRHTGPIDHAVGDEGLVAICGTPLLVDEEFVGVLFASNRTARPFSREEVLLLGSLAALAAVTILQLRAAASTAAALDQLSVAHAGVEHAAAAHDRFAGIVLSGGDVDAVAAALAELLGVWVVLVDAAGHELAVSGRVSTTVVPWQESESGRLTRSGDCWVVAVTAKRERLGALVIGGVDELSAADQRIVERAAVVTALVLLFRRQAAEQSLRAQADLLTDVLSGAGDLSALTERLRLLAPGRVHDRLVVAVCRGDHTGVLARLSAPLADKVVLSGAYGGDLVLLLARTDAVTAARGLSEVAKRCGVTVAVTGPAKWGEPLVDAHRQASRLAGTMLRLGRCNESGTPDDLGVAGLIGAAEVDVAAHVQHLIGAVIAYDAQRGTDLLGTLHAYFAAGQSPTRAANELHIHPNTVQQRLDRVSALLGADWQTPERGLNIQVALRLHQAIRAQ
ncbi:GAF domain-containing protein [Kribbella sandramycini]|uniref:GAF domain-containing protein n=1 Tax=Kribbella sandramycini TaxID=60450 RepID=A0A7Y4P2R1_9ACTN|nr:helix-turn-helix domain-containing protein [Kribbella sandramycini]MBB6571240.1 GAF domain-containing protein [Kribbella sandramycini]NOL43354.1 GAF domain-containing protein [Kribbella sandramycini]